MEKLAVGLWLLVFGLWLLAIWDLKISNLKIIGRQIFKSTNFQINKSTLWVLGDG
jgi:hypothetical protein